jgi:hypothetical protein
MTESKSCSQLSKIWLFATLILGYFIPFFMYYNYCTQQYYDENKNPLPWKFARWHEFLAYQSVPAAVFVLYGIVAYSIRKHKCHLRVTLNYVALLATFQIISLIFIGLGHLARILHIWRDEFPDWDDFYYVLGGYFMFLILLGIALVGFVIHYIFKECRAHCKQALDQAIQLQIQGSVATTIKSIGCVQIPVTMPMTDILDSNQVLDSSGSEFVENKI